MTSRKEITSRVIALVCESLMQHIVGRQVQMEFAHLGQGQEYNVAIQTSLFEFDPESGGGLKGPMYLTMNASLLQDISEFTRVLSDIIRKYRGDAE